MGGFLYLGGEHFSRFSMMVGGGRKKNTALTAVLCLLMLMLTFSLSCGASSLEAGSKQTLKVQKHLKRINKTPVKSIQVALPFLIILPHVWLLGKLERLCERRRELRGKCTFLGSCVRACFVALSFARFENFSQEHLSNTVSFRFL